MKWLISSVLGGFNNNDGYYGGDGGGHWNGNHGGGWHGRDGGDHRH